MADTKVNIQLSADGSQARREISLLEQQLQQLGNNVGIPQLNLGAGVNAISGNQSSQTTPLQRAQQRMQRLIYRESQLYTRELQTLNRELPALSNLLQGQSQTLTQLQQTLQNLPQVLQQSLQNNTQTPALPPAPSMPRTNNAPNTNTNTPINDNRSNSTGGGRQSQRYIDRQFAIISGRMSRMMGVMGLIAFASHAAQMDYDRQKMAYQTYGHLGTDSNFSAAARRATDWGKNMGYDYNEVLPAIQANQSTAGFAGLAAQRRDITAILGASRAYNIDANTLAQSSGRMSAMGLFKLGDQQKFANMLAKAIKEGQMQGREREQLSVLEDISSNLATRVTTLTPETMASGWNMYNAYANLNPSMKGERGGSLASKMINIANSKDTGFDIAAGMGTKYTGLKGEIELRRLAENDPQQYWKQVWSYYESNFGADLGKTMLTRKLMDSGVSVNQAELAIEGMKSGGKFDTTALSKAGQDEGKDEITKRLEGYQQTTMATLDRVEIKWNELIAAVGEGVNKLKTGLVDALNVEEVIEKVQTGVTSLIEGFSEVGNQLQKIKEKLEEINNQYDKFVEDGGATGWVKRQWDEFNPSAEDVVNGVTNFFTPPSVSLGKWAGRKFASYVTGKPVDIDEQQKVSDKAYTDIVKSGGISSKSADINDPLGLKDKTKNFLDSIFSPSKASAAVSHDNETPAYRGEFSLRGAYGLKDNKPTYSLLSSKEEQQLNRRLTEGTNRSLAENTEALTENTKKLSGGGSGKVAESERELFSLKSAQIKQEQESWKKLFDAQYEKDKGILNLIDLMMKNSSGTSSVAGTSVSNIAGNTTLGSTTSLPGAEVRYVDTGKELDDVGTYMSNFGKAKFGKDIPSWFWRAIVRSETYIRNDTKDERFKLHFNNPGGMDYADWMKDYGATPEWFTDNGGQHHRGAKFDTWEHGMQAQVAWFLEHAGYDEYKQEIAEAMKGNNADWRKIAELHTKRYNGSMSNLGFYSSIFGSEFKAGDIRTDSGQGLIVKDAKIETDKVEVNNANVVSKDESGTAKLSEREKQINNGADPRGLGAVSAKDVANRKSAGHGLKNVPYDLYPANLHKGERVLTKLEAEELRDLKGVALPSDLKIDEENDSISEIKHKHDLQEQYKDSTQYTSTNLSDVFGSDYLSELSNNLARRHQQLSKENYKKWFPKAKDLEQAEKWQKEYDIFSNAPLMATGGEVGGTQETIQEKLAKERIAANKRQQEIAKKNQPEPIKKETTPPPVQKETPKTANTEEKTNQTSDLLSHTPTATNAWKYPKTGSPVAQGEIPTDQQGDSIITPRLKNPHLNARRGRGITPVQPRSVAKQQLVPKTPYAKEFEERVNAKLTEENYKKYFKNTESLENAKKQQEWLKTIHERHKNDYNQQSVRPAAQPSVQPVQKQPEDNKSTSLTDDELSQIPGELENKIASESKGEKQPLPKGISPDSPVLQAALNPTGTFPKQPQQKGETKDKKKPSFLQSLLQSAMRPEVIKKLPGMDKLSKDVPIDKIFALAQNPMVQQAGKELENFFGGIFGTRKKKDKKGEKQVEEQKISNEKAKDKSLEGKDLGKKTSDVKKPEDIENMLEDPETQARLVAEDKSVDETKQDKKAKETLEKTIKDKAGKDTKKDKKKEKNGPDMGAMLGAGGTILGLLGKVFKNDTLSDAGTLMGKGSAIFGKMGEINGKGLDPNFTKGHDTRPGIGDVLGGIFGKPKTTNERIFGTGVVGNVAKPNPLEGLTKSTAGNEVLDSGSGSESSGDNGAININLKIDIGGKIDGVSDENFSKFSSNLSTSLSNNLTPMFKELMTSRTTHKQRNR